MTGDPKRVQDLFLKIVEVPQADRLEVMKQECVDDVGLRRCVEALLQAYDEPDSLLDLPVDERQPKLDVSLSDTEYASTHEINSVPADSPSTRPLQPATIDNERKFKPGTVIASRYTVQKRIGEGGMGVVLRAIDANLQRQLALKVMRTEVDDQQTERFLEEARITGQLQHPGIPPVHEIGRLEDGLPFFSMKLIEGRTLSELLRERKTPRADVPRFLKIFEQIAQTLAYAHSQGVIHRDLKPSNIMIGAFGEVQVMDWGLAKRLPDGRGPDRGTRERSDPPFELDATGSTVKDGVPLDETIDATPPSPEPNRLTQAGQVMGTPAYMPPEQANGEIDRLDERSDVFGLGAILSVILTGEPPYEGNDAREVLRRAQQGDLVQAWQRLDACGTDADVAGLSKACLSIEPQSRPHDAGVVAEQITAYLASVQQRLKDAEIERATAQATAIAERKRRRIGLALAASLLVLIIGSSAAVFWYERERILAETRKTRIEDEIVQALDQAKQLRQELLKDLEQPDTAMALHHSGSRWKGRLDAASSLVGRSKVLASTAGLDLAEAFLEKIPSLRLALDADVRDRQHAERLEAIRMDAAASTEGWFYTQRRAGPKYAREFREAGYDVENGDLAKVAARIRESTIRWHWVAALDHWASVTRETKLQERLLYVARGVDPDPLWRDRFRDPSVWRDLESLEKLVGEAQAVAQSPALIATLASRLRRLGGDPVPLLRKVLLRHPGDFWLHLQCGAAASNPVEGAGYTRAALAVRPEAPVALNNLATALSDQGRLEEAIAAYRRAVEVDPDFALAHLNLAKAFSKQNKLEDAMAAIRTAIELDPTRAEPYSQLGVVLRKQNKVTDAIVAYRKAIELDPDLVSAYHNLGSALSKENKLDDAIAAYRKAIELDPTRAEPYGQLGVVLRMQNKDADAIVASRKAIELDPDYAQAYVNLGTVFRKQNKLEDAIAANRKAIELEPNLSVAHYNLGNALDDQNRCEEAIAEYRKTVEIDPNYAEAWCNLGAMLRKQGEFGESYAAYRRGHELGSGQPNWRYPSDRWLRRAEQSLELEQKLSAVLAGETSPADVAEQLKLAQCLYYKKQYAAAARFYADAFAAQPGIAGGPRYNAACATILATVKGNDADNLSDAQRTAWRNQAIEWLQAALRSVVELLEQKPDKRPLVVKILKHWQTDPDLATLRDEELLARLPPETQTTCRQFWSDVRDLIGD